MILKMNLKANHCKFRNNVFWKILSLSWFSLQQLSAKNHDLLKQAEIFFSAVVTNVFEKKIYQLIGRDKTVEPSNGGKL